MTPDDEDVPVLNAVVRCGDASVIQSSRLQRFGIRYLDAKATAPIHFELPPHLQFDDLDVAAESPVVINKQKSDSKLENDDVIAPAHPENHPDKFPPETTLGADQLESLIDDIIDRHVVALRQDLRRLLERVEDRP